jgi:hypothetical protein
MKGWQCTFQYPVPCRTARQTSAYISERCPIRDGHDVRVSMLLFAPFREQVYRFSDPLLFQPAIFPIKIGDNYAP